MMASQGPEQNAKPSQPPDCPGDRILAPRPPTSKARRRWQLVAVGLAAVLAAAAWYASLRRSTGSATGTTLDGPAPAIAAQPAALRIGLLNIHGCVGRDGRYDPQRVARSMNDLDIVGLNEVRGWSCWQRSNQAAVLGGLAGTGWLFAPAEQRWFCQQFGNGLLTTVPIDRWQRIPLPNQFAKSCRNMLLVQTRYRNRTVHILLTHLIRSDEPLRRQQFEQASALFLSLDEPALLAGDLNADGSDPQIKELLRTPGVIDALGSLRRSDQNRGVDWLLLRGLQPMEAGVRDDGASDHPLVWAAVTLPGKNDPTTTAAEQERGMASTKRKRLQ